MLNLSMIVEDHARKRPGREAVVCGATRLTYGELDGLANQVANGLRARGIRPGDHVALGCPNVPYFPIAYFGILKAGAVVVPLNVLLRPNEIAYHLQDCDARVYLCFEGTSELPMGRFGRAACDDAPACEHFIIMPADPAAQSSIENAETFAQLIADQPTTFETVLGSPDDTAVILYTSGTTGRPKGAELTHANMLLNAITTRELGLDALGVSPYRSLIVLPLFHSFGQTCQMNAGLYTARRSCSLRASTRQSCSRRWRASASSNSPACQPCSRRCCTAHARRASTRRPLPGICACAVPAAPPCRSSCCANSRSALRG